MKVILKENVKYLGQMGDVVNVSNGYAINFLIPKNFAVEANTKNVKEFEHNKKNIMEKAARIKEALSLTSDKLSSLTLIIKAKAGEEDKLFGSVTNMDISEALASKGYDIDKKKISIEEPIKRLGLFNINIKLNQDITAQVKVQVVNE